MVQRYKLFSIVLMLLLLISAVLCVSPVFVILNISGNFFSAMLLFLLSAPMFYILSQLLHTVLLLLSSVFYQLKPIYLHLVFLTILETKLHYRIFFSQLMGFSTGIAVFCKGRSLSSKFFNIYYLLYFLTIGFYYVLFGFVYVQPLLLPLIPFSIIIVLIQKLYRRENQQLFLLKSKVVSLLCEKSDGEFNCDDYEAIWKVQSKSELPFVALSYLSLVKEYLSKKEIQKIELIEVRRLENINCPIALYGMLDVLKLNLYLRKDDDRKKYEVMLEKMLDERPNFIIIKQNINESLNGVRSLSLSLAISELQLFLEVFNLAES